MLLKIVAYFMVLPPVRQGIILRQYGYVHHGRVEGSELPVDGLQFVGAVDVI